MRLVLPVVPLSAPETYLGAVCRDVCRRGEKPITHKLTPALAGHVLVAFYVDHGAEPEGRSAEQARKLRALGFDVEVRALIKARLMTPAADEIRQAAS